MNVCDLPSALRAALEAAAVEAERLQALNGQALAAGDYVLYWMQAAQRAEDNPALEFALACANRLGKPLLVGFGLTDRYPEANARHYAFMLEGLADVASGLRARGLAFAVKPGDPGRVAPELAARAALVVCDRGYLRQQRAWRTRVAEEARCLVLQVEGEVVVPAELASNKREVAARTLRPKLQKHLERFLALPRELAPEQPACDLGAFGGLLEPSDPAALLRTLEVDGSVAPVARFRGGARAAKARLERFLAGAFSRYAAHRNQPHRDDVSHMSKYLHFGQISPVYLARRIGEEQEGDNRATFLEELIVRRELPVNFVLFEPRYDQYAALPAWARATLQEHASDQRAPRYPRSALEAADSHDPYWNAAMREMLVTGYMHNHMRMYWGKKILEWSATPEEAFETALALNNRYFLDGRDANSFANVAWVFGQHDRPWAERAIFGKVRSMTAGGLRRKTDPEAYVRKVDALEHEG